MFGGEWAAGLPPLTDDDDDSQKTLMHGRLISEDAGGCLWAVSMFANQIDGIMIGSR